MYSDFWLCWTCRGCNSTAACGKDGWTKPLGEADFLEMGFFDLPEGTWVGVQSQSFAMQTHKGKGKGTRRLSPY